MEGRVYGDRFERIGDKLSLAATVVVQGDIMDPSIHLLPVPRRLAMADQQDSGCHSTSPLLSDYPVDQSAMITAFTEVSHTDLTQLPQYNPI